MLVFFIFVLSFWGCDHVCCQYVITCHYSLMWFVHLISYSSSIFLPTDCMQNSEIPKGACLPHTKSVLGNLRETTVKIIVLVWLRINNSGDYFFRGLWLPGHILYIPYKISTKSKWWYTLGGGYAPESVRVRKQSPFGLYIRPFKILTGGRVQSIESISWDRISTISNLNENLLTYPLPWHVWRWFYFSQGGIC